MREQEFGAIKNVAQLNFWFEAIGNVIAFEAGIDGPGGKDDGLLLGIVLEGDGFHTGDADGAARKGGAVGERGPLSKNLLRECKENDGQECLREISHSGSPMG